MVREVSEHVGKKKKWKNNELSEIGELKLEGCAKFEARVTSVKYDKIVEAETTTEFVESLRDVLLNNDLCGDDKLESMYVLPKAFAW